MTGLEHNPFLSNLGVYIVSQRAGGITLGIALRPVHLNRQGVLQGGVVSALLDAACGYAGLATDLGDERGMGVTISLNINFISAVREGVIHATGTIVGSGRKIYFATGHLCTADGRVLASAQGVFKYGIVRVDQ